MEVVADDGLDDVAAQVGEHWAAAGENDRAMHYFEVAADRAALGVFANEETIALYRKAISLTGTDAIAIAGQSPLTSTRLPAVAGSTRNSVHILMLIDSFDEARMAVTGGIVRLRAETL